MSTVHNSTNKLIFIFLSVFLIFSCANTSPQFEKRITLSDGEKTAEDIFQLTFNAHGGSSLGSLNDVNVSIDGEWYYLITKIQPIVTDTEFRQQSEERILVNDYTYASIFTGPSGQKQVFRTLDTIAVTYNNEIDDRQITKDASALTSDAFYLFTLGALALENRVTGWKRLSDSKDNGNEFYRINGELKPGIGLSNKDFITLWINKESGLTYRLHITLEGFETTKGAHVDTTYLNYLKLDDFILPTHFFERVRGPISIDAHEWWYTGIDINRGLQQSDVSVSGWTGKALAPAKFYDYTQ